MKEDIIPVDLYKRGIAIVSGDKTELELWLSDNGFREVLDDVVQDDWNWENTNAITTDNGVDVAILSIKPMDEGTAVHEFSHATFRILNMVGISPTLSEESYAYLLEFLFTRWREITSRPSDAR